MKCPDCGAEINSGKFCEYCGAQISTEMLKEQEQFNKKGCPKCGSTNVSFRREKHGEIQEKKKKVVVHETVGLCKDCGFTWTTTATSKKRKTWLWVLGWIFIFPLPLTLILVKKQGMKPVLKYGIIAVAWLFYLIFVFAGGSKETADQQTTSELSVQTTVESEVLDEMSALQAFYDDFRKIGALDNIKELVTKYGLYSDHRKDGIGHDTYKVAYTKDFARVISNADLETDGNYVIIKFNLLQNDAVDSITLHTNADELQPTGDHTETSKPSSTTKSSTMTEPATTTTTKPSTTKQATTVPVTTMPTSKPTTTTTTTTTSKPTTTTTTTTTKATIIPTTVYIAPTTAKQTTQASGGKQERTTVKKSPTHKYVLNTSTKRIHDATCGDIDYIKMENYSETDDFDAAINSGYKPCGNCNPYSH